MRLVFLGTASAFVTDADNYQSNLLLQSADGRSLLIDCGTDARRALHALGLSHRDITDVYVSHLHADHAGGLEWLAFARKFDENHLSKPVLYLCEQLAFPLWEHTLSGGLTSLSDERASLSAYFQVHSVGESQSFTWSGIEFTLVESSHIESPFAHMPSYGLFFAVNGCRIFLTTDAQFQPVHSLPYYERADLIFQDCETVATASGVHAHYRQLITLDPAIKAKMWLYHYNSGPLPDAAADGFRGFVRPGQEFFL
jgi:ribonuclease BN (tRNA processing enzyme)